jgi:methylmalonyl-CoA/ethylmalonyl-CoA epimerase
VASSGVRRRGWYHINPNNKIGPSRPIDPHFHSVRVGWEFADVRRITGPPSPSLYHPLNLVRMTSQVTQSSGLPFGLPNALFTAIDHVGIAVADLDQAIAFYQDVFGMRLTHQESNAEQGVREAMMAVGDSGSHVQLLAPLTPESTIAKFLDRSGPGVQQVAYRVDDIDAVSSTLRQRGLRLLYDEPKRGTAGSRVNFIHPKDAGGVLVELVEPGQPH